MDGPDSTARASWQVLRDAFFAARRIKAPPESEESDEPLPFHAVNVEPRENYIIKNPCPNCNPTGKRGGRMFKEFDVHTLRYFWSCYSCGRAYSEEEWKAHVASVKAQRNRLLKARACGKEIGRPKVKVKI